MDAVPSTLFNGAYRTMLPNDRIQQESNDRIKAQFERQREAQAEAGRFGYMVVRLSDRRYGVTKISSTGILGDQTYAKLDFLEGYEKVDFETANIKMRQLAGLTKVPDFDVMTTEELLFYHREIPFKGSRHWIINWFGHDCIYQPKQISKAIDAIDCYVNACLSWKNGRSIKDQDIVDRSFESMKKYRAEIPDWADWDFVK